jgi:DNA-binding transcriptional MocR family regulator
MKKFDFEKYVAKNIPSSAPAWSRQSNPRYDFAVAYPDPDSFPANDIQDALSRAIKERGRDLVLYPHPQGDAGLRDLVVEKLEKQRNMKVDPTQVIITAGSGQAISLLTQLFIDRRIHLFWCFDYYESLWRSACWCKDG